MSLPTQDQPVLGADAGLDVPQFQHFVGGLPARLSDEAGRHLVCAFSRRAAACEIPCPRRR
jgi:hypothetical protein